MLDYKERAIKTLRLLKTEFSEFIERIIEHSDTTPGLVNSELLTQVSSLITDIESEKSEISKKITSYFESINRDLKNEEYFLKVIEVLDISEALKTQCREILKKQIFTEEQFKIFLGMVREVEKEQKLKIENNNNEYSLDDIHNQVLERVNKVKANESEQS